MFYNRFRYKMSKFSSDEDEWLPAEELEKLCNAVEQKDKLSQAAKENERRQAEEELELCHAAEEVERLYAADEKEKLSK